MYSALAERQDPIYYRGDRELLEPRETHHINGTLPLTENTLGGYTSCHR